MKDLREIVTKRREVALYAALDSNMALVLEVSYSKTDEHYQPLPEGERREMPSPGFVRISQPMEITFAPIDTDAVIRNAARELDAEEHRLRNELHDKLAALNERRSQLLALTHEVVS